VTRLLEQGRKNQFFFVDMGVIMTSESYRGHSQASFCFFFNDVQSAVTVPTHGKLHVPSVLSTEEAIVPRFASHVHIRCVSYHGASSSFACCVLPCTRRHAFNLLLHHQHTSARTEHVYHVRGGLLQHHHIQTDPRCRLVGHDVLSQRSTKRPLSRSECRSPRAWKVQRVLM